MAIPAALAKKIAQAKTSTSGNNIKRGSYTLVVKRILCESKFKGTQFIPEFDVEDCEKQVEEVEPNKIGSDCSCAWALDAPGKKGEAMLGNVKQFVCALLGLDLSTDEAEIMKKADEYAGPSGHPDSLKARGMRIECTTRHRKIQTGENAGTYGDFPEFINVTAGDGNSAEEIAKRRAALDVAGR